MANIDDNDIDLTLDQLQASKNIVELLDNDDLLEIGTQVVRGYEIDEDSRAEWKETVDKAMLLAKQVMETKNYPWPNASNIKFPIITKAAINYASRTMPEIIQNDKVVKCAVVGQDPDGSKYRRANRVADYMSDQFVNGLDDWEDGLDKMLQILAVTGVTFKKTYYNTLRKKACSELCLPDKIVVNYDTQTLDTAKRITHIIEMSQNDVVERQRSGIFCDDVEIESLRTTEVLGNDQQSSAVPDADFTIQFLEQHCYLDLDDDGYKEPYIVTVHKTTKQVMRIVSRFDEIKYNEDGEVQYICPVQYFTDYHFLRSPDGGFYSIGFGTLLLPLNASVNTILNQLINAGTLATTTTGLISRGLRIKNGEFKLKMGEYSVLDAASTTDISKAIYTLPFKEPSSVLFQLLELLIKVCEDVSSTTDVMQGKQPAQNVASGTISQLVEQGTKIFGAINKRVYRSLKKEYEKVYRLNSLYLDNRTYKEMLADPEADVKKDFELDTINVYPIADPTMSTINQRLNKAIAIMQLQTVDHRAADHYLLEALQIDKSQIKLLLPTPDPKAPPPVDQQKIMAEIDLIHAQIAKLTADVNLTAQDNQIQAAHLQKQAEWTDAQIHESATRNWKAQKDAAHNDMKLSIVSSKMRSEQALKAAQLQVAADKNQTDSALGVVDAHTKALKVAGDIQGDSAKLASDVSQSKQAADQAAAATIMAIKPNNDTTESVASTEHPTTDDSNSGGI